MCGGGGGGGAVWRRWVVLFGCSDNGGLIRGGVWGSGGAILLSRRFGREEARVLLGRRRVIREYKEIWRCSKEKMECVK